MPNLGPSFLFLTRLPTSVSFITLELFCGALAEVIAMWFTDNLDSVRKVTDIKEMMK